MNCRRKNSPHSLSSYKRRNKLQQVVLSLFKLYECFKKSKLLNSCALKYIDKLNFVAFRSVRPQQGKLQEKKTKRERTFSKTVLRINGQRFLFKMFLRNLAVNLWREICGKHFGKVCKKDYNWKSRFGCPFSPTYLNLRACKATIFHWAKKTCPYQFKSIITLSSPFDVFLFRRCCSSPV